MNSITHEFFSAIIEDRDPEIDIYEAVAYVVPGIVAHQSVLRDGKSMQMPGFDE